LRPSIKEKLKHYEFININQLLQKAVSRLKESCDSYKSHRLNVHFVGDCSDDSDDDNKEFLAAKIKWLVENKLVTCPSLKLIHKN
jgi:hypothetical protein